MLHAIAVSKELNSNKELDVFVYKDNRIYLYSPQWELEISFPYDEKIRELASQVDRGELDWIDLLIEDGQEIIRRGKNFFVDGKAVKPFRRLSNQKFASVGPVSSKIFNEFLRSQEKGEKDIREILLDSFEDGLFSSQISNMVEFYYQAPIEIDEFNNLDKQIIVRIKIEGYKFIINFIKNILKTDLKEKIQYCETFLSRVFILESQNFIKVWISYI